MSKLRISLTQKGDEIKGTVELPGDPLFVLEALSVAIEAMAKKFEVTPDAVVRDLYSVVCGKVKS